MVAFFILLFLFSILGLFVGLIRPSIFYRLLRGNVTRKKIAMIFGGTILVSFIGIGATAPSVDQKDELSTVTTTEEAESPDINVSVADNDEQAVSTTEVETFDPVSVVRVIDGDTLVVSINGTQETIRVIGIDTPETVDPRKPVECFGLEASAMAKTLLEKATVRLETDESQGERDKYDRLLRYVFLADGTDFGEEMIREGYAYEYTYSSSYKYQEDYKSAQTEAEEAKRGLWADGACQDVQEDVNASEGATTTVETEPSNTATDSTQSSIAETTPSASEDISNDVAADPEPAPAPSTTTTSCSCASNSYNCGDFSTHAEAQAVYDCCLAETSYDVHSLDSDDDGQACESLP